MAGSDSVAHNAVALFAHLVIVLAAQVCAGFCEYADQAHTSHLGCIKKRLAKRGMP